MSRTYTVIDSFTITEALRERGADLPLGIWLVLDGQFRSTSELPDSGQGVVIATPNSEQLRATVAHVEVRHGSGAVSLVSTPENLPRLSMLSVVDNVL